MTNDLHAWAVRHGVPYSALAELLQMAGAADQPPPSVPGASEAAVQARVRVRASQLGWRLWRNNVGAALVNGAFVRWGLCNDSAALNTALKSSDLIGLKPNGQFVALEIKEAGWTYSGTPHEEAQLRYMQVVGLLGGDARFVTDEGQLR